MRLFADWDIAGLKAAAHRRKAEPRTEYLYLLRLAEDQTEQTAWIREFEASSWGRKVDGPPALRSCWRSILSNGERCRRPSWSFAFWKR